MMVRNLIFYCYPVRGTAWAWHVPRLLERRDVWNGRRLLVVALDQRTESLRTVVDTFSALQAEVLVVENDPKLGEAAHFVRSLGLLESTRDDEATFYAHAKGVTRHGPELVPILSWSRLMYDAALGFPALVDRKLVDAGIVGSLRYRHVAPRKGWCFAGTFFWLRHSAIFTRDWRRIDRTFYGVEDYPGTQFKTEESYCLTGGDCPAPTVLYSTGVSRQFADKTLKDLSEEDERCIRA